VTGDSRLRGRRLALAISITIPITLNGPRLRRFNINRIEFRQFTDLASPAIPAGDPPSLRTGMPNEIEVRVWWCSGRRRSREDSVDPDEVITRR
jgi:hypothetical protein